MFGFNYKLTNVNPTKGIVKLTPTKGTWAKALLPAVVVWVVIGVMTLMAEKQSISFVEGTDPEDPEN